MRLRRLEPVLRRAIRGPCALAPGATLMVAVSGGADSTALLIALASIAREFGLKLAAAHLDHGLRGADSRADAAHVEALCARLRVPLTATRIDAAARMRRAGTSGEAGLRALRRRFLVAAMRRTGAVAIATAHTADDQLETLLMRLARGTSARGMAGMRPRHGVWLKPLLEATRHDVEQDLARARIAWRTDVSNASRVYFRNRIRLDVVPALLAAIAPSRAGDPQARARLARRAAATARDLAAAADLLARRARTALVRASVASMPRTVDSQTLALYPAAVQRSALQLLWTRAVPALDGLSRRHLDALQRLVSSTRGGARLALPHGWAARWSQSRLSLLPPDEKPGRTRPANELHPPKVATDDRLQVERTPRARSGPAVADGRRASRATIGRTPRRTKRSSVRSGAS